MNITKLPIDSRKLLRKPLLAEVKPYFNYENGIRSNTIAGHKYVVVLPDFAYEKMEVKIAGEQQMDTPNSAIPVIFEEPEVATFELS